MSTALILPSLQKASKRTNTASIIDALFARSWAFQYDAQRSSVAEFARLRATKPGWNQPPTPTSFCKTRSEFLSMFNATTAPADRAWTFFCKYSELDYHYNPETDSHSEFERLAALWKWRVGGKLYREQQALLQRALAGQVPQPAQPTSTSTSQPATPPSGLIASVTNSPQQQSPITKGNPTHHSNISSDGIASPGPVVFTAPDADSPLAEYFSQYGNFQYNPASPARAEFQRLVQYRGWKSGSKRFRKARAGFMRATGDELMWRLKSGAPAVFTFGDTNEEGAGENAPPDDGQEGVTAWKRLCQLLELKTPEGLTPSSKTQCKKVLKHVYINIFDFIDYLTALPERITLTRSPTLKALAEYSYAEDKVFSKHAAKKHELLRFLLHRFSHGGDDRA